MTFGDGAGFGSFRGAFCSQENHLYSLGRCQGLPFIAPWAWGGFGCLVQKALAALRPRPSAFPSGLPHSSPPSKPLLPLPIPPHFLRGPSSRFAHVTPDTFPSSRGPQLLLQTGAHCLLPLELSHLGEVPTCANLHRGIVHIAFDLHSPLPGLGFLPGLALPPTSEHRAWLPAEAVRLGGTGLVQPRCQAREHSFAVR